MQDLVKSQNREIRVKTYSIALQFDVVLESNATEMPATFQNDTIIITPNRTASRLAEILQ